MFFAVDIVASGGCSWLCSRVCVHWQWVTCLLVVSGTIDCDDVCADCQCNKGGQWQQMDETRPREKVAASFAGCRLYYESGKRRRVDDAGSGKRG